MNVHTIFTRALNTHRHLTNTTNQKTRCDQARRKCEALHQHHQDTDISGGSLCCNLHVVTHWSIFRRCSHRNKRKPTLTNPRLHVHDCELATCVGLRDQLHHKKTKQKLDPFVSNAYYQTYTPNMHDNPTRYSTFRHNGHKDTCLNMSNTENRSSRSS